MAHTLKPFRDYSEHDVINLFAFDGSVNNGIVAEKGTVVKVKGNGFQPVAVGVNGTTPVDANGSVGQEYLNAVADRWVVGPKVEAAVSGDEGKALGITLLSVREHDENGEKLIFNPRKAAEMNVVVSGQAVPVLTRGVIVYSGDGMGSSANPGDGVYLSASAGDLTTSQGNRTTSQRVGTLLSKPVGGVATIKINF